MFDVLALSGVCPLSSLLKQGGKLRVWEFIHLAFFSCPSELGTVCVSDSMNPHRPYLLEVSINGW